MPEAKVTELRAQINAAVDELTSRELVHGLKLALVAFNLKISRLRLARDKDWMRHNAALIAQELLFISTGGTRLS